MQDGAHEIYRGSNVFHTGCAKPNKHLTKFKLIQN